MKIARRDDIQRGYLCVWRKSLVTRIKVSVAKEALGVGARQERWLREEVLTRC